MTKQKSSCAAEPSPCSASASRIAFQQSDVVPFFSSGDAGTVRGKVYKLALDGGMTCPNRDGTLGTRGCIFCSEVGAGEFASPACTHVAEQLAHAKQRVAHKNKGGQYIAYFQSFTNTYAPLPYLDALFRQAIASPEIVALSIATRPGLPWARGPGPFAAPQSNQTRLGGAGTANHTSRQRPLHPGAGTRCRSMITQSAHSKEPAWK